MEGGEGEELGKCEGAFLSGQVKTPIPISSYFSSFKLCEYSIGAKSLDSFHGFAFGFTLLLLQIMREYGFAPGLFSLCALVASLLPLLQVMRV